MEISPNSTIKLLSGVPLTNSYEHTIHFPKNDASAQTSYFNSKVRFTFDQQMYQRYAKGTLRIRKPAGQIYGCNYLMFQNTAFDTKWFYAFITSIDYINNEVTEIKYEIDVIQTYWYNWQFGLCYIQRCHTPTDNLFEHTVEENLPCGDAYVQCGDASTIQNFDMNQMSIVVLSVTNPDGGAPVPRMVNNVFVPLKYKVFKSWDTGDPSDPGIDELIDYIDEFIDAGREDAIVAIYQFPTMFTDTSSSGVPTYDKTVTYHTASLPYIGTPKNKKCFNYPYHFLRVSNNSGITHDYHYEDFNFEQGSQSWLGNVHFDVAGTNITMPNVLCFPKNHRRILQDVDFGITYNDFPEVGFTGDTFKAWWAQAKYSIIASAGKISAQGAEASVSTRMGNERNLVNSLNHNSVPSVAVSPDTAGAMSVATSAVGLAYDSLAAANQKMIEPPDLHGQAIISSLNMGMERCKFTFYEMSVKPDILTRIDDFFTRYGYKVDILDIPNTDARPHWTYLKTAGCTFTNIYAPTNEMQMIEAIFDKGITFWHSGSEVGNFNLDNSPST